MNRRFPLWLITLLWLSFGRVGQVWAEGVRILISVSAKTGLASDKPLKHAGRDADRVTETMVRLGDVKKEHALRVSEPTRAELERVFERARTIAAGQRSADVTLMLYFSGHGDRQSLHLAGESIMLADLAKLVGQVPAALKVVVTDACRTADGRSKGPAAEPAFAISVKPPPSATGAIWIHASADGEVAQESDELEGAIFTHYWLSALAGAADVDGDKRVTLHEAYTFAYNQTLFRSGQGAGVLQRPEADVSIKEVTPLVLTRVASQSATLRLPQSADHHYLVYTAFAHAVMAEAWGDQTRRVEIGLPPGRYLVQRRGARAGALEISLSKGQTRELDGGEFRDVPEDTLARKGGDMVLRPHELSFAYGVDTSTLADLGQRVRVQYAYALGAFAVGVGVDGGLGVGQNDAHQIETKLLGGRAFADWRVRLTPQVSWMGTVALRGMILSQSLLRKDAAVVGRSGYPTEQVSTAAAFGPELRAALRFDGGAPAFFEIGPWAAILLSQRGGSAAALPALGAEVSLGFGL